MQWPAKGLSLLDRIFEGLSLDLSEDQDLSKHYTTNSWNSAIERQKSLLGNHKKGILVS